MKPTSTAAQKKLALALLDWHDGQSSPLYAVGSCMLSDSDKGRVYDPANHRGHTDTEDESGCLSLAILDIRTHDKWLAEKLAKFKPSPSVVPVEVPEKTWNENEAHPLHLAGLSIMEGVNVVAKLEDFSLVQIGSHMVSEYNASAAKDAKIKALEEALESLRREVGQSRKATNAITDETFNKVNAALALPSA